ncbi:craniofacial development protein 2-like [Stylophora pistillata]|uniref:craniofacial development protein 2-like n=1 Tax=Stylophora pistillata TaxID=50429 RepID=UPI000C057B35|nr:craniofacial development protein 2-like [Stylophora pistillata]
MNAKVGSCNRNREIIMGKEGTGAINNNGKRLTNFCEMNSLIITGTLFPHEKIHKNTWTSPDGRTQNQIDHVLVNQQFRRSVQDTRVLRGADVGSDHQLVRTKVKLKLKKITKPTSTRTKYDTGKLQNESIRKAFSIELRNQFSVLESIDDNEEEQEEEHEHDIDTK